MRINQTGEMNRERSNQTQQSIGKEAIKHKKPIGRSNQKRDNQNINKESLKKNQSKR
jgi:hypothetical protein